MTQAFDILAAIEAEANTSADQNVSTKGGGGYTPPAAGLVRLRFVQYFEMGKKEDSFEGKPKITDEVRLVFELSGPKHQPKVLDNGDKIPQRITVELHKSTNEKAGYYKLFRAMNYDGKAKIMAQLLGKEFLGTIFHKPWKSDPSKVNALLKDPTSGAFTVRAPFVEDAETGETRRVTVDPAITPLKCFLWNNPSLPMWASIHVAGQYDAVMNDDGSVKFPARSKNVLQERIKAAINFDGSPIAELLKNGGDLDLAADKPAAEAPGKPSSEAAPAASSAGAAKATAASATASAPPAGADDGDDPLAAF